MQANKANEAQFVFLCGNLDANTFQVVEFRGEDSISSLYDFAITLSSSSSDIAAEDVVNKQATLYIYRDGEYYPYSGVVAEFRFLDTSTDRATYSVRLVPRLWLLSLNIQTRIFQKMAVDKIVKKVFDEAGLSNYCTLSLEATYPEREFVVQYQESDLDFISRLMEKAGIWYLFKESPLLPEEIESVGAESMIISDKPDSFENINGESDIIFRAYSGMTEQLDDSDKESVNKISCSRRIIPKNVFVKNYNYRTPELDLSSSATVQNGDAGTVYKYGGDFKNSDEARKAADVIAAQLAAQHTAFDGRSNCRGLRAGKRFTLSEHGRSDCNDTFLVRRIMHAGAHGIAQTGTNLFTYTNDFTAIPSALIDTFRPEMKTPVPRINGVISAMIEANGSDYASVDDMGRYKVRMTYDIADTKNSEGSKYVRLAQPYSGASYGMHFPSHEGAEMLLACVEGDPDKPVGVGTIPNANTVSPVVGSNKEQSVIRTAGGNEIVMDDTDGKQKIRLTTNGEHCAEFDDENKKVYIQTTDGNKLELDDKNEAVSWNAKDHNITMTYKGGSEGIVITSKEGHVINIDDNGKMVTIQTNAGHIIQMNDQKKVILLSDCNGKNTVSLDGEKGMVLETKGKLSISADQDIDIKGANIKMTSSKGKIEIKAAQDLGLEGMKIMEKATTDYKLDALNIEAKAKVKYAVEANVGVELKSRLQAKLSGTMAEVSGSAMTTIKGGIVMIN